MCKCIYYKLKKHRVPAIMVNFLSIKFILLEAHWPNEVMIFPSTNIIKKNNVIQFGMMLV